MSGAEDNCLVSRDSESPMRESGLWRNCSDQLVGTQVIVSVADSVLRQGMRTLMSEFPLWVPLISRDVRSVDFGSIDLSRCVLILADADIGSVQWSDIPLSCKVLILIRDPSRIEFMEDFSRADGFLLQSKLNAGIIADAVSRVLSGDFPMPSEVARELLLQGSHQVRTAIRSTRITERQRETLILLSEGLSNRQIGRRLRISEHGAKRLVTSVLAKLDAPNRASAVASAMRQGIL
ncbi:LuxR C-terminal-related transcriptional regulator [Nocardiopsis sp. CNT312]|uniref:helix-turn-helix transcriptional regulator n=1 Tax=Nocardiopsis sp. CNT312 TaxID=1137268 RepID=UPI0018CC02F3|nr:LuxR C-terminal-related transcriptional regulator [Nocardiopsis sp. CNT312]